MNAIYIYGTIGQDWWDDDAISAGEFVTQLNSFAGEDVDVYVNSPGGDAFDGSAIYSAIQAYPGRVTAHIDGLAASSASFCVLSADEVVISPSALVMVHCAWTYAQGNATALRDTAGTLEKLDQTIAGIYARKSGMEADEALALMEVETWMSAEEAVEAGLCDSLSEDMAIAAHVNKKLFAMYRNAPEIESCNGGKKIEAKDGGNVPEQPTGQTFAVIDGHVYQTK